MPVNTKTLGWIAVILAMLPLFLIPEIVWASREKAPSSHVVVVETGLAPPAVTPERGN